MPNPAKFLSNKRPPVYNVGGTEVPPTPSISSEYDSVHAINVNARSDAILGDDQEDSLSPLHTSIGTRERKGIVRKS